MKSFTSKDLLLSLAMYELSPSISAQSSPRIPTVFLAGDSTMAPLGDGSGTGTQGWGQYLQYSFANVSTPFDDTPPSTAPGTAIFNSLTAFINNSAIAGRSARSYTMEGSFNGIAAAVQAGDWVVIEFGHNDGGSPLPASQDDGRSDCPGQGNETCVIVVGNVTEIIQTYPTYLIEASRMFLDKGAKVVLSSPTPDNPWETGTFTYAPDRFTYFSWLAATELGGPDAGVYFVPHGQYTAQAMQNLGATVVDANYPVDHTHTAPFLADIVSQAFVLGLKCGTSGLADLVVNATARIEGPTLGTCILANATLPI